MIIKDTCGANFRSSGFWGLGKEAKLTIVQIWDKEVNVDLDYNVKSDKAIRMRCKVANLGKQE